MRQLPFYVAPQPWDPWKEDYRERIRQWYDEIYYVIVS